MLVMHRGSYAFHPSLLTGMPSVLTLVHKTLGEKKTDKARLFHSFLFNFSLVGQDLVANLIYLQFTQCNANIDTHTHTHMVILQSITGIDRDPSQSVMQLSIRFISQKPDMAPVSHSSSAWV